jgi:hypothetical protein
VDDKVGLRFGYNNNKCAYLFEGEEEEVSRIQQEVRKNKTSDWKTSVG